MKARAKVLDRERDFYFSKLKKLEQICMEHEHDGKKEDLINKIFEVLYATEVRNLKKKIQKF